jgi:hypothetical protein
VPEQTVNDAPGQPAGGSARSGLGAGCKRLRMRMWTASGQESGKSAPSKAFSRTSRIRPSSWLPLGETRPRRRLLELGDVRG